MDPRIAQIKETHDRLMEQITTFLVELQTELAELKQADDEDDTPPLPDPQNPKVGDVFALEEYDGTIKEYIVTYVDGRTIHVQFVESGAQYDWATSMTRPDKPLRVDMSILPDPTNPQLGDVFRIDVPDGVPFVITGGDDMHVRVRTLTTGKEHKWLTGSTASDIPLGKLSSW
jgi:hypothetical protein